MFMRGTENCCAAALLGGWGNSHGGDTHLTFESFRDALFLSTLKWNVNTYGSSYRVYYGFLNSSQHRELQWLRDLKFEVTHVANLDVVTIDGALLYKTFRGLYEERFNTERRLAAEAKEAARLASQKAKEARVVKTTGAYRKRGEFRVRDYVYQWFEDGVPRDTFGWPHVSRRHGVVTEVFPDGRITVHHRFSLHGPTTLMPVVATGYGSLRNIQRRP